MFSVTQYGTELDKVKYNWDEKIRIFSTNENNLVLDFSDYHGVTFNTGSHCTFITRNDCTFKTSFHCAFKTGCGCTFDTGANCAFKTGCSCIFKTNGNCFVTRNDVKEVIEIPEGKTIKLNDHEIVGYKIIEDSKPCTCNGKIVEMDGKKYKMVEIKDQ